MSHMSLISRLTCALLCCLLSPLVWVSDSYAQSSDRRGFLWEVRKGKQVAWLLGTIHVGRPEFYPLPPSRLTQLKRAQAIVLEADISDSARAISATQKYALYPEGAPGLETRLTPELRQRVEAVLSRNQLDLAPMMRMKPWMLANVLALFEAAQAGYVPALSVEAYLLRIAKSDNKPILEFEGIEQQFELFELAPWATQIAFLEDALKAVETRAARRELNRIVQAWETADLDSLERLLAEIRTQSSPGARFTVDTILLGRHPLMVRKIETMMADGKTYLFAVGALHLAGPQGLVEQLRARGYTLTEL
ncbi:MAG: TraB/GumN family protein [Burkholderiaceae bacterium]